MDLIVKTCKTFRRMSGKGWLLIVLIYSETMHALSNHYHHWWASEHWKSEDTPPEFATNHYFLFLLQTVRNTLAQWSLWECKNMELVLSQGSLQECAGQAQIGAAVQAVMYDKWLVAAMDHQSPATLVTCHKHTSSEQCPAGAAAWKPLCSINFNTAK